MCKERGLRAVGKTEELRARLRDADGAASSPDLDDSAIGGAGGAGGTGAAGEDIYGAMTFRELQARCSLCLCRCAMLDAPCFVQMRNRAFVLRCQVSIA